MDKEREERWKREQLILNLLSSFPLHWLLPLFPALYVSMYIHPHYY
jgi:hypothetical protein